MMLHIYYILEYIPIFTAQMNCGPHFQLIRIHRAICFHRIQHIITKVVGFKAFFMCFSWMKVFFLVTRKSRSALGLKKAFSFHTETGNLLKMLLPYSLRIKLFESRNQRKVQHNNTLNGCITSLAPFITDNYAKYPFIAERKQFGYVKACFCVYSYSLLTDDKIFSNRKTLNNIKKSFLSEDK